MTRVLILCPLLLWLDSRTLAAPPFPEEEPGLPGGQQGVPHPTPQAPVYIDGPFYIVPVQPPATALPAPRAAAAPRAERRLAIGVRGAALWTSQKIYNVNVLLGGAGIETRLGLRPRVSLATSIDLLGTDVHDGFFRRVSAPLAVAGLFSLLPSKTATYFNAYASIGAGLIPTRITLAGGTASEVTRSIVEAVGQLGLGCELRLGAFALFASAHTLGLVRLGAANDEAYVPEGVHLEKIGLPQPFISPLSYGWMLTAGALLWL